MKMISEREDYLRAKRIAYFQQLPGFVIPKSISANNSEDIIIT